MIFTSEYLFNVRAALAGIEEGKVEGVITLLKKVKEEGKRVWVIGNGGSAAQAEHFAQDLSMFSGIPTRALTDISSITAYANDVDYTFVFTRQLEIFAKEGDVLFALSTSWRSNNIRHAVGWAKTKGLTVVGLTGKSHPSRKILLEEKYDLNVPSEETGIVQDGHSVICHMIANAFLVKED